MKSLPDIYTGGQFTVTGDRVEIPDWERPQDSCDNLSQIDVLEEITPQEEFVSTQNVNNEERLLDTPSMEQRPLSDEELRVLYHKDWERLCQQEKQRAYLQAKQEYSEPFEECLQKMDKLLCKMEGNQQEFFAHYATELKHLAIDIAEKWLNQRLQDDGLLLEKLVLQSMANIKDAKWMDVELSSDLVQLTEKMRQIIEASGQSEYCKIKRKKAPVGTCIIKTDKGELDASIHTQAQSLRSAFSNLEQFAEEEGHV